MQQRPMKPLLDALSSAGVTLESHRGFLPVTIQGGKLRGGEVTIDTGHSSQFLSALMLVAPCTEKGFQITASGEVASAGYVELTAALQRKYGIDLQWQNQTVSIRGSQKYQIERAAVEGDYSNISYFVIGTAISGGEVQIGELERNSAQGDRIILQLAEKTGASIHWSKDRVIIKGQTVRGIDENMNSCPDLVPSMAVLALFADAPSRFRQVGHLRYKESDRLTAIIENIRRLQGKAYLQADQKAQLFKSLLAGHPKIKEMRHIGLMMAVDLESAEQCSRMIRLLAGNGAVADAFLFRPQAFRIGPPLIISEEEIQKAGKIILHCLDQL